MSSASHAFAALDNPTVAQVNGWAQGTLGYAVAVAPQAGITTQVDLTGLTVTVTLVAGRRIKISASAQLHNSTATSGALLAILDGATQIQQGVVYSTIANFGATATATVVVSPSAGSHTYKLQCANVNGGTVGLEASATFPAMIHVEDVGAV